MNHLKSSLSKLSAVAAVLGLAACSHNQQAATQPPTTYAQQTPEQQAPSQQTPSTSEQYGSTMGQSSTSGTESGATPSTNGATGTQGQGAAEQNGMQNGTPGSSTSSGALGSTGTGATSTMGGTMDVSSLNDGQLAAVLVALHQGQIQEAQLAQTKAKSPDVKKLAQRMATAHQSNLTKEQTLFSQLQITPSDNAVSQQLQSDAQNQMSTLQSMRGRDFDRDYVDDEIKAHNQALELIDRMIPNAKNPQLKAELEGLRPKLQQHLQEAEKVQQKLEQGATNKQAPDTNPSDQNQH